MSPVISDGLCLFRSVEVSLKHQGIKTYTYRSLKAMVCHEVVENWAYYEPFCVASKTRCIADLDAYVNNGKFDQTIADVCVAALCNAIGVTLVIYDEINATLSKIVHPPGRSLERYTVQLLRSGSARGRTSSEHYDALLAERPSSSTENDVTQFTMVAPRIKKLRKATTILEMFKKHAIKKAKVQPHETDPDSLQISHTDTAGSFVADEAACDTEHVSELLQSPSHAV